jgi:hypothetical protein
MQRMQEHFRNGLEAAAYPEVGISEQRFTVLVHGAHGKRFRIRLRS